MIVASSILLIINEPSSVISSMLSASADGVNLCINLLGIYTVWLGIINVLDKSGLSDKLAHALSPLIKKIFKSDNEEANRYIAINISSNILGLGNAATPSGIKAMQLLDDKSGKITFSALALLVVNSVSIQLLPTTVIGLRQNAGSESASDIIIPTILASILTCTFAIILVYLFDKIKNKIFIRKTSKDKYKEKLIKKNRVEIDDKNITSPTHQVELNPKSESQNNDGDNASQTTDENDETEKSTKNGRKNTK